MSALGDPADKGVDTFTTVANRRAGYGDKLQMALRIAKAGGTLYAGEGELLVQYYEERIKELQAQLGRPDDPREGMSI